MKVFLLVFLIPFFAKSQELNVAQTLDYINKQLNDKDNKSAHTAFQLISVYNYSLTDIWGWDYTYNIKVEHGFLIITKTFSCGFSYHPDYSTYENRTYSPVIEEFSVPINDIDDEYNYYTPYLNFYCNTQSEYNPSTFIIHTKDERNYSVTKIVKQFFTNGNEKDKKTGTSNSISIEFSNKKLSM